MAKVKVLCALSGGVDSAVAAALLKNGEFLPDGRQAEVSSAFIKFCSGCGKSRNFTLKEEKRAKKIARVLNIPFFVLDLQKEFKQTVIKKFLEECKKGKTPNPCVVCNKEIKFGLLAEKALELDFDFIATGHYARKDQIFQLPAGKKKAKALRYGLFSPEDKNKDQTYFLYGLGQKQLRRALFPLGEYSKIQVKKMAEKFNLPVSGIKESQEVCFIPNRAEDFLREEIKENFGEIVDAAGKKIGRHKGLWFYTIGQRKGMGLAGGPYYVCGKNIEKNILIVSKEEKDLIKKKVFFKYPNWISGKKPVFPLKAKAKIRYRSPLAFASVNKTKKRGVFEAVFTSPQKAVAPGQSIVFYSVKTKKGGREVLGGGTII